MIFIKKILNYLLIIWQFPQYIVGTIFYFIIRKYIVNSNVYKNTKIYLLKKDNFGGISFGPKVFVYNNMPDSEINHELGHSKQSLILGPLYLLVIGLPSLIHAYIATKNIKVLNSYYEFYTEKWADILSGIKRK